MKTNPPVQTSGKTPMERMTDLTRRIIAVPRTELVPKRKRIKKRKKT